MKQKNIEENGREKTLEDFLADKRELYKAAPYLEVVSRVYGLSVLSLCYIFSESLVNNYDKLFREWGNIFGIAAIGYSAIALPILAVDGLGDLITGRHHETFVRLEYYTSKLLKRERTPITKLQIDYDN